MKKCEGPILFIFPDDEAVKEFKSALEAAAIAMMESAQVVAISGEEIELTTLSGTRDTLEEQIENIKAEMELQFFMDPVELEEDDNSDIQKLCQNQMQISAQLSGHCNADKPP